MAYNISRYQGGQDAEIAALVLGIQKGESGLNLSIADQPDLLDIVSYYRDGGYWIAVHEDKVVGTIGLLRRLLQEGWFHPHRAIRVAVRL